MIVGIARVSLMNRCYAAYKINFSEWDLCKLKNFQKSQLVCFRTNVVAKSNVEGLQNMVKMKEECEKPIKPLNFKNLMNHKRKVNIEIISESKVKKKTSHSIVDLKLMKEELKQLEDPPVTPSDKQISQNRLPFSFYNVPCETLAKNMLGKILVRKLENGVVLKGRIVETESYLGIEDKASHTYGGKVTPRNTPMFMPPGTIYVYFTYGMYHCFNISSQEEGSAVLVRAIEPLEGIEIMNEHRSSELKVSRRQIKVSRDLKNYELCNGPSKMCISLKLNRSHSKYSLCTWKDLWIENDETDLQMKIVECPRIGIESAGEEWAKKPLRFYIYSHKCVSKRDKKAESIFSQN